MAVHIHEIDLNKHEKFLNEGRKDPFTKEKLKAGDRIVFCATCKSAFLHDSWEAMRGRHCEQSETLNDFPYIPRLGDVTKLEAENKALSDQLRRLNRVNRNFKIVMACSCFLITGIAGITIYLSYYQYKHLNILLSLNAKVSINNCPKNKSESKNIGDKIDFLKKQFRCITTEYKKLKKTSDDLDTKLKELESNYKNLNDEKDFYKNALNGYPYYLISNSEIAYKGYLSTSNNKSNPLLYRLYVPYGDRFNIYLGEMTVDGDFEIINLDGSAVADSRMAKAGDDQLLNFYLPSGIYNIKVWNHTTNQSSYFVLRIYRK